MDVFETAYEQLNGEQKQAVDSIDGPVLVVAGPGTGKTQLLSMRVANILRKTDELPENILCLTFSEAGTKNMQERLRGIIGPAASKVGVFTFHGFGTEVINRFPEYFFNGADMQPVDELGRHRLFDEALASLGGRNYFTMRFDNEYTMLAAAQELVSDMKRAGLTSKEVRAIAKRNVQFITFAEPLFSEAFSGSITKETLTKCQQLHDKLKTYQADKQKLPAGLKDLHETCMIQLAAAIEGAAASPKVTPPLTAFKTAWRNAKNRDRFVLKAREQTERLLDAADVYEKYHELLSKHRLFDYDDMIVQVVHELETNDALKASLQEQYHYILVDEYQDTNLAQARILHALADNPVNEGRPNILVVGDDDQAIYAFQGADISNVLDFSAMYPSRQQIVLRDNYRSNQQILDLARSVILQGEQRLENRFPDLNKSLKAALKYDNKPCIEQHEFTTTIDENSWLVNAVKERLANGVSASEIAVISSKHKQLQALVPFLQSEGVAVTYERRENVLEAPHILVLLMLARIMVLLQEGDVRTAESLLPELLTHPMWELKPETLWDISIKSYQNRDGSPFWLTQMQTSDDKHLRQLAEWLITTSQCVAHESLEAMLDILIGSEPVKSGEFRSPYHEYYFSSQKLAEDQTNYLDLLEQLTTLRRALRNYEPGRRLFLADLLEFAERCRQTGTKVMSTRTVADQANSVQLLSAHGAKGLEFETVFIIDCNEDNWAKVNGNRGVSYPLNLAQLKRGGRTSDDQLRLFFVGLTRAKNRLYLSRSTHDDKGSERLALSYLATETAQMLAPITAHPPLAQQALEQALELDWHARHRRAIKQHGSALGAILANFQLSATALDTFLDLEYAGPQAFFERQLLRFPTALKPSLAFGNAVHHMLQTAHVSITNGQPQTIGELLDVFKRSLERMRLSPKNETYWLERGRVALPRYLEKRLPTFTAAQLAERDFKSQGCAVDEARLTGKLDVLEIKEREVIITDYKTGTPTSHWSFDNLTSNTRLYQYRRQLMFYKLLVETSAAYGGRYHTKTARLDFVQPTKDTDELLELTLHFDDSEVERLKKLIVAVWKHVMALDFPDTSRYGTKLADIKQFEQDLIDGTI
ncbi:MAG TPA: ATP-dependent DNA helicase [Candidatus Saccharimonadales bacterium]|nr:ATP-dependent DNA helicase [Candidatus Saccharimonadales bacterium]